MHTGPAATALAFLLLACATRAALAQGLVSPGPLSAAHARLDDLKHCLSCHDAGRELSGRKCLACHVSIAREIRADRGYHAVATRHGAALACASCHSEHNGRPYQLVDWKPLGGRERFDHGLTGWPLEGAHARLSCQECHRAALVTDVAVRSDTSLSVRRTYLGLATACASCHLDEHRGRVSRQCQDCHNVQAWKPAPGFDHDRTRFPLTGLHRGLRCSACHRVREERASGPAGQVDSSFVDFNAARPDWRSGCSGCHASPHRAADRVGACERCHTTLGWFVLADSVRRFDHAGTGFPLRGAHAAAPCESCHLSTPRSPLPARVALVREDFLRPFAKRKMLFHRCDACHADVHAGQLPDGTAEGGRDCKACHTETAFTPVVFSLAAHDSGAFPLTGAHQAVPCSACHVMLPDAAPRSGRIRFRFAAMNCASCHRDPHGGQFAGRHVPGSRPPAASEAGVRETCTPCHTAVSWAVTAATFDHDSAGFPLRGAHLRVACDKCHLPAGPGLPMRFKGVPTSCDAAQCHGDPHAGQFRGHVPGARVIPAARTLTGTECAACHTEVAWAAVTFDHDSTGYPLRGAHVRVACGKCHTPAASGRPARFKGLGTTCGASGCHADPHGGQFASRPRGGACASCHTDAAWATLVFNHLTDSDFPLDGAHRRLPCADCHRPEGTPPMVRYYPLPHRCEDCHAVAPPGAGGPGGEA